MQYAGRRARAGAGVPRGALEGDRLRRRPPRAAAALREAQAPRELPTGVLIAPPGLSPAVRQALVLTSMSSSSPRLDPWESAASPCRSPLAGCGLSVVTGRHRVGRWAG